MTKKEKVDKVIELNYYHLSYRRRLIRTLIATPILALIYLGVCMSGELSNNGNVVLGVILGLFILIQIIYNFYKWKRTNTQ